jgi:hypothetical protein
LLGEGCAISGGEGIVEQILVELRDELLQLAESEESTILCPSRTSDNRIAGLVHEEDTRIDEGLTRECLEVIETIDGGVRDAVLETKVYI